MNSKVLNALSILCLIIVVGVMSWRDMHPKMAAEASSSFGMLTYYAGADITPAMVPDDSKPVTVGLGEFSYTPDGKTVWTPQGMPPATFAQRQVNMQFHFKNLPHSPVETIQIIKGVAESWVRKGNTISVLVLDYSADKNPDFKAYADLLKAAHAAFSNIHLGFTIYAGVNILWQKDALKDLQDYSPQFLIHLPEARISPELLSRLEAFKYNVVLQFPAGVLPGDIDAAALKKLTSLTGVALTLDPHKPLPKKEEKIGLFPKL